jgi:hypothetical protein
MRYNTDVYGVPKGIIGTSNRGTLNNGGIRDPLQYVNRNDEEIQKSMALSYDDNRSAARKSF